MHIERNCKYCKVKYFAQKKKQNFCSRKCFKQNYYYLRRLEALENFPIYKCPKCEKMTKLNFDPCKNSAEWINYKCPWCNNTGTVIDIIVRSTDVFIVF
jgi:hypothetical protein